MDRTAAISPTGIIVSDIRVDFLRKILMTFKKEIHLIWDGAKIHAGQAVKEFLVAEPEAKRLFLYRIPPYSPELNPTEQLWNNMKNVFSKNKQELRENLNKTFDKIKQKQEIIKGFFKHPKIVFGF